MLGPVLIWYAAGVAIAVLVALDVLARRRAPVRDRMPITRPYNGLLWLALGIGGLIFAVWPWVALSLARNATL